MNTKLELTESEIEYILSSPECLNELANYHSCQDTMADAAGFDDCSRFHAKRSMEFHNAAVEAQAKIDAE